MVRHTSVNVPSGMCYGRLDVPLRDTFPQEARAVHIRLAEMSAVSDIPLAGVYSSPSSRCTRLAAACGFREPVIDTRLMEKDFGEWEGQLFDEIRDPRLQEWYGDYLHVAPTGGESFSDQLTRVQEFMKALKRDASDRGGERSWRYIAFTHGGTVVAASVAAGLCTHEDAFGLSPNYGEVRIIHF